MNDDIGNRLKVYEGIETERKFMPLLPIYARIDGRGFSKFTKGMRRPYDTVMTNIMVETVKGLVDKTHAKIGYTQSDEISLVWHSLDVKSTVFFDGKIQKMTSVLAGLTTSLFIKNLIKSEYGYKIEMLPHFDCRVFTLPTLMEAANTILWREQDATKNAISMAASHYYSHRELQGKSGPEKQEMLFSKGVNFNQYPDSFKRGTFVKRVTREETLDEDTWLKIPENKRPPRDFRFTRSKVEIVPMPRFGSVTNRVGVIFNDEDPVV